MGWRRGSGGGRGGGGGIRDLACLVKAGRECKGFLLVHVMRKARVRRVKRGERREERRHEAQSCCLFGDVASVLPVH